MTDWHGTIYHYFSKNSSLNSFSVSSDSSIKLARVFPGRNSELVLKSQQSTHSGADCRKSCNNGELWRDNNKGTLAAITDSSLTMIGKKVNSFASSELRKPYCYSRGNTSRPIVPDSAKTIESFRQFCYLSQLKQGTREPGACINTRDAGMKARAIRLADISLQKKQ